jgi:GAF domain-containing protein
MPPVQRSADNAAGAAYRTGKMQIVLSRPGGAPGAIVAPILTAEGCIGALSAEISGGGEASESAQALATIFAAHLATVLADPAAEVESRTAVRG